MSHNAVERSAGHIGRMARRLVVIAAAAAANALAWLAGHHAHVDYIVQTPLGAREITLPVAVAATIVAGAAGWAVFSQLEQRTVNTGRAWITLAALVLTASIVPIFLLPAALGTRLSLTALHCIAAVIFVIGLPYSPATKPRSV